MSRPHPTWVIVASTWAPTVAYGVGLMYASVCTKESDEDAARYLNLAHPTGIASQWSKDDDESFATGEPNPCPCPDDPTRRHVLFSC